MARASSLSLFVLIFITVQLLSLAYGGKVSLAADQIHWVVANPSANQTTLQSDIDHACSQIDCSSLQEGGPCFYPDTAVSHASVAMNLYFIARAKIFLNCMGMSNSCLATITDPSYGTCKYPSE